MITAFLKQTPQGTWQAAHNVCIGAPLSQTYLSFQLEAISLERADLGVF